VTGPAAQDLVLGLEESRSRSREQRTFPSQQREAQVSWIRTLMDFLFDKGHRMGKVWLERKRNMAIDFDALDLVRGENKARSYNKKLDGLQQQVTSLQELVKEMVSALPKEKQIYYEEKIKTYLK
jgi:hypothetical protein